MNDRANEVLAFIAGADEAARVRAFVFEVATSVKNRRAFETVAGLTVPAPWRQFSKHVLGDGYVLLDAVKVQDNACAELLAMPYSTQGILPLWDEATADRVRELTERRDLGERLLLRCMPLACDLAAKLSTDLQAEEFLAALPYNKDEALVVRALLDMFATYTTFSAGVTSLVPFTVQVPPPATVTSGIEEEATGWTVKSVSTVGSVTLSPSIKGKRSFNFECSNREMLRALFEAWHSHRTVGIKFYRVHPIGLKRPNRHGILEQVDIEGIRLLAQ